jgi:hypothetical protein
MPSLIRSGTSSPLAADPNYVGAFIDLPTLTASVPAPVLGNWGMAGGTRFDWSGTAWVNTVSNLITTVPDKAARLAMPNPATDTFQMVRQVTDNIVYLNVLSPASTDANWIPITNESTVQPPVLVMAEPANAGQVVRIGTDGKGYLAYANSSNTPLSPVPTPPATWPVTPDYLGVQGIMGLASAAVAVGGAVDIGLVSLKLADWSLATHDGSTTLTPGTKYALSQTMPGKIIPFSLIDYNMAGSVIQGIGYALDSATLVVSYDQLFT